MGQIDIQATVRIGSIWDALQRVRRIKIGPILRRLVKPARADQKDHGNRQRGPRGAWPARAPSTIERMMRSGRRWDRRILAKLPFAIQSKIKAERSLFIRSRVPWSMAHQDGPTRVGRGARLPNRQFLWISRNLKKEVKRHFEDALYSEFRKFSFG